MRKGIKIIAIVIIIVGCIILGTVSSGGDHSNGKIGERVEVGFLEYKVEEVLDAKELENIVLSKENNFAFLAVKVTVTNLDKESTIIDPSMFQLIEADGTVYDLLTTLELDMANRINPKLSKTGYIIFDVPSLESDYSLKVSSGFLSMGCFPVEEKLISLIN